jgi:sugar lactone lactonase YvrE
VADDGTVTQIADLSAFYEANPVDFRPDEDHFPPGNPYSMIAVEDDLYVLEANHDELDRVALDGTITRVADIAAALQAHVTSTALTAGTDGLFYVGTMSPFPYLDGTANIYAITPEGELTVHASELTAVLGLAFDCNGVLYILESKIGDVMVSPWAEPGSGRVIRQTDSGFEEVATGLTFPTGMTFSPDWHLYVSNVGYGHGAIGGQGEIVRIDAGLADSCT